MNNPDILHRVCAKEIRAQYLEKALSLANEHKTINGNIESKSKQNIVELLTLAWPSATVSRSEIHLFSGGVLHPRTMANRDSAGTGIKPMYSSNGRKVFYMTIDAAQYLVDQID